MTRKPVFWIVFVLFAVVCLVFTIFNFKEAFSILNVSIEMDRDEALLAAAGLMTTFSFGPVDYNQAIEFRDESEFQSYVELEAGGKDAYQKIIDDKVFRPFTWVVRHFSEGKTNETTIVFTPDGKPYEFREKLAEDKPGAALGTAEAREIADQTAARHWSIDFSDYSLVEESQKKQPSGRVDWTFEYEREQQKIGDAPYRLKLIVGGDRLIELDHYYKIPEAFQRKYREMRSANNTISFIASIALAIFYIVGGCIIGLFILMRKNYVLWKQPLFWGIVVSFLSVMAQVNFLPLYWMDYDTALSSQTFIFREMMQFLSIFLFNGLLLVISFMAAESLTRLAFPGHVQLWRSWSPEVASSKATLGKTSAAYLLIVCFLAYEVLLQFIGKAIPGWWSPASPLTDPNILASYLPWLSPIARSLHAGFWEECLFRAVPLAGAALIGQRIGHRRTLIVIAFVAQALIFGGGHANYPAQPSFARVLELIIPSMMFGFLYLRFGLLPAIVMHYAFDVVLMSLPIFAARGLWFDKIMVVIMILVPMLVVLVRRIQVRSWSEVPEEMLNSSWSPPPRKEKESVTTTMTTGLVPRRSLVFVAILGLAGILLSLFLSDFQRYAPRLEMNRSSARETALEAMSTKSGFSAEDWRALTRVESQQDIQHRFIWQEGGPDLYSKLMGTYLSVPRWEVRFARFEGDLAKRAEEFSTILDSEGSVQALYHVLPEDREGADLTQQQAMDIVLGHIKTTYSLNPEALQEISAISTKQPNRRDWTFTYAVPTDYPLQEGQARIEVMLGGDEVLFYRQFIFVPEAWERAERQQRQIDMVAQTPFKIAGILLLIAFIILSLINWSKKNFSRSTFFRFLIILSIVVLLSFANGWPLMEVRFSTAEPLNNQILIRVASLLFPLLGFAFLSMILGFIDRIRRKQQPCQNGHAVIAALSLSGLAMGLAALIDRLVPTLQAPWPTFDAANTYLAWLQPVFSNLQAYIVATLVVFMTIVGIDFIAKGWTDRRWLGTLLFFPAGFVMQTGMGAASLIDFLTGGLLISLFFLVAYIMVFRFHFSVVPLTIGFFYMVKCAGELVYNAWPGAVFGNSLAIVALLVLSFVWFRAFNGHDREADFNSLESEEH